MTRLTKSKEEVELILKTSILNLEYYTKLYNIKTTKELKEKIIKIETHIKTLKWFLNLK